MDFDAYVFNTVAKHSGVTMHFGDWTYLNLRRHFKPLPTNLQSDLNDLSVKSKYFLIELLEQADVVIFVSV